MALIAGTRLGPYEIVAAIGVGGMGEVYKARDTRLNRDVAIKVLLPAVADDPERLARFQREAQLLAALNHSRIAVIYGLEESGGARFLAMELVDGESLADRLRAGALPLTEALAIAGQIAEALDAAHEKGIIHRDLKPANIMLTAEGHVKVLDFGLAKMLETNPSSSSVSLSPTLSVHATYAGVILGTAAYMSPEQARGKTVDKRADIWAFGCVLYEMIAGKRAFDGEDVTDTIAAVVRAEPDWNALPREVPEQIRLLLKRCLEKDRQRRVSDIGVARFLMTETIAPPAPAVVAAPPRAKARSKRLAAAGLGAVAVILLIAIAVWVGTKLVPQRAPQPTRFVIVPPATMPLSIVGADRAIAISPDGANIVYRAGLQTQLVVRAMNELDARPITSILPMREPFISPDGHWIGFFASGELRKVSISGGPPITLCGGLGAPTRGAAWGPDDTIVFALNDPRRGLLRVPSGGGEPKTLTVPDAGKNEIGHFFPSFLPGGRAVLFTVATSVQSENGQIDVLDLETGRRKTLLRGGSDGRYADSGHLVYAAGATLRAVRFDLARLEVTSDPVPVLDQVLTTNTGEASYAFSRDGTLVYVPAGSAAQTATPRSLVWVNRQRREEPIKAPLRTYVVARLSPDGTRVALDIRDQSNDIWIWDLARQTLTPLNLDPGVDMSPLWTPDSRRIIWTSSRGGGNPNVFWQAADGTGAPERLTTSVNAQFPTSISPDGARVLFYSPTGVGAGVGAATDLYVLTLTGERRAERILQSPATKFSGEISPDGRWLAYQSNESGQFQIYVRPFPQVDAGRSQVSPAGGTRPAWARNGRELFYLDANDQLTSVPVQTTGATFSAGSPAKIQETRYYTGATTRGLDLRAYDLSADGQRFLMIKDSAPGDRTSATSPSMVVVLNWFEELKARLPVK